MSIPLPTYSGFVGESWDSFERRLLAWMRSHDIPPNDNASRVDCLLLALLPAGPAAAFYAAQRRELTASFDSSMEELRRKFDSDLRREMARARAINELDRRRLKDPEHKREMVAELVNDLETLLVQAGVDSEAAKRDHLLRCFTGFGGALQMMARSNSYDGAVLAALKWEHEILTKNREKDDVILDTYAPPVRPRGSRRKPAPNTLAPSHHTNAAPSAFHERKRRSESTPFGNSPSPPSPRPRPGAASTQAPAARPPPPTYESQDRYPAADEEKAALRERDMAQQNALDQRPHFVVADFQNRQARGADVYRHTHTSGFYPTTAPYDTQPPAGSRGANGHTTAEKGKARASETVYDSPMDPLAESYVDPTLNSSWGAGVRRAPPPPPAGAQMLRVSGPGTGPKAPEPEKTWVAATPLSEDPGEGFQHYYESPEKASFAGGRRDDQTFERREYDSDASEELRRYAAMRAQHKDGGRHRGANDQSIKSLPSATGAEGQEDYLTGSVSQRHPSSVPFPPSSSPRQGPMSPAPPILQRDIPPPPASFYSHPASSNPRSPSHGSGGFHNNAQPPRLGAGAAGTPTPWSPFSASLAGSGRGSLQSPPQAESGDGPRRRAPLQRSRSDLDVRTGAATGLTGRASRSSSDAERTGDAGGYNPLRRRRLHKNPPTTQTSGHRRRTNSSASLGGGSLHSLSGVLGFGEGGRFNSVKGKIGKLFGGHGRRGSEANESIASGALAKERESVEEPVASRKRWRNSEGHSGPS